MRQKYEEVLEIGLHVLEQLGESIPVEPTDSFSIQEVKETLALVKNKAADEKFMRLVLNDSGAVRMQVLTTLTISCFYFWPKGVPILASRMVQFTLNNGISKFSAVGFALLALLVSGNEEHINECYQIGKVSLSLLQKFQAKEWLPNVYCAVYNCCNHWHESVHKCIQPLMQGYQVALEVGKIDMAKDCAKTYFMNSFYIGNSLEKLRAEIEALDEKCTSSVQHVHLAVLNLLGHSENNSAFLAEAFHCRKYTEVSKDDTDFAMSLLTSMIVAYIFNEYDMALKWSEQCRLFSKNFFGGYAHPVYIFYDCLVALASAKSATEELNRTVLHENMSKLRKWSEISENHVNKISLLDAEMAALCEEKSEAIKLYNDAILLSKRYNFIHEKALAYERAGIFYLEMKCPDKASHFLSQSYNAYMNWGATAKASQLNCLYPGLIRNTSVFPSNSSSTSSNTDSLGYSAVSETCFMNKVNHFQNKKARMS